MRDKAFASLTSGLLARKGHARPAMRPQGFTTPSEAEFDLGWDDMGEDFARPPVARLPAHLAGPPTPPLDVTPEPPLVLRQQQEIAREFEQKAPASLLTMPMPKPRAAGRKAAFTLRLDTDRHLRLRLACMLAGRSAQALVTDALDRLLATLPEVERLATSLPGDPCEDRPLGE